MTRIRRLLLVAITLVASLTAGPLIADDGFVGVWKLVSYSTQDPDTHVVFYPFGERATGYIVYTAEGRMFAILAAEGRKPLTGGNRITAPVEDRADAFTTATAYSGTYTLTEGQVVHHVDISVNPNWVGTDQVRFTWLEGNRLTIVTPPLPTRPDGKLRVSTLVWERTQ
jgi:Lipocalin-like domain